MKLLAHDLGDFGANGEMEISIRKYATWNHRGSCKGIGKELLIKNKIQIRNMKTAGVACEL